MGSILDEMRRYMDEIDIDMAAHTGERTDAGDSEVGDPCFDGSLVESLGNDLDDWDHEGEPDRGTSSSRTTRRPGSRSTRSKPHTSSKKPK